MLTESQWLEWDDPVPMVSFLRSHVNDRRLQLFACGVCRKLAPLMGIVEYELGLEAAERYANGERTKSAMKRYRQVLTHHRISLSGGDSSEQYTALFLATVAISERDFRSFPTCLTDLLRVRQSDQVRSAIYPAGPTLREIFGNPFRPVSFSPSWRTSTAVALASQMYESRDFSAMPILADALQDAGCDNSDVLDHCRGKGPHVRGCWVVDLVLGKE
ncbi:Uncharacterized protein (Fragment) OS=uncultured bacterium PE=4 SV=1 [Gemmata massiliana]|uniref:SMI1/KNR4 family protein n=1 Tax=Gemmata massiliana TaxID=1210884 RepID=A0A6P2DC70_9BACT